MTTRPYKDRPWPGNFTREERLEIGAWLAPRYRNHRQTWGGFMVEEDDGSLRAVGIFELTCLSEYEESDPNHAVEQLITYLEDQTRGDADPSI